ncbi:2-oxo-4-hydroxy-4-carboxy-5-ureidoimidazoline decarboxylase [Rhodococcus pyridinivorans]
MTALLNDATDEQAFVLLLDCCASPQWAHHLIAARPYRDLELLLARSDAIVMDLPEPELDLALAGHPRIGDRTDNDDSTREQAAVTASEPG